jgi:hypothetical protein
VGRKPALKFCIAYLHLSISVLSDKNLQAASSKQQQATSVPAPSTQETLGL